MAFTAVAWVQALVGELRSYKLFSAGKKKVCILIKEIYHMVESKKV